ncbi:MAG TPA: ABC transporter permease [Solirubrobacteraceae bacterium]|nr:ABC transporter permease [Solirubrobacteraceae bacterium]
MVGRRPAGPEAGSPAVASTGAAGPAPVDAALAQMPQRPLSPLRRRLLARMGRNRIAFVGAGVLVLIILFCFIGPLLYHTDQTHVEFGAANLSPGTKGHSLGTDQSGYDVLGRLMAGGQTSLIVCVSSAALAATVGSLVGAIAGFAGGVIDSIIMRFTDALLSLPQLFVVIVVATMIVPSRLSLIILIGALSWFSTARLVRGEALRIRNLEYVDAARVAGARSSSTIFRHVLPNAVGVIVVSTTFQVADAILLLASLDFLGLGIPPPAASWGGMLTSGLDYIADGYWWLIAPVGVLIVITVTAVNFIGEGLRDALEVRLRER